ncbi:nucleotide exchange factor GrpE [Candidatus Peregrinibacteria bacterium CG10_big_fil_rev_8_21_14_0_10_49_10]|nr:MAG: nucleotide exchange factor GrpE [Candidatus Peregrinibacteria bacterium CG10_big_fil_rev_8_21_14_0_10_49_10]
MHPPKKKDHPHAAQSSAAHDKMQAELERLKELAARAQADLQNAKGRMEKEAQAIRTYAVEGMLVRLLPTVDSFQRAFAHLPEELKGNDWVSGLQVMEQAFIRELGEVGLRRMESLGKPADPALHEVLQAGPGEKDVITKVFEEGYLLHDKVLRPAKVMVGDGSAV